MIEYKHTTGGRYLYNEDVKAIQDIHSMLSCLVSDSSINFVVRGCEPLLGGGRSGGLVFLNGKFRLVDATDDPNAQYIINDDKNGVLIDYADQSQDVENKIFAAKYSVTSSQSCISLVDGDYPRIVDLFRHYALVKQGAKQSISGDVEFYSAINLLQYAIYNGSYQLKFNYDNNNELHIDLFDSSDCVYSFVIKSNEQTISFYSEGEFVWEIGGFAGSIQMGTVESESVSVQDGVDAQSIFLNDTDIKNIFAFNEYPIDTGWLPLVGPNGNITSLVARQYKNIVSIYGYLPVQYIVGSTNSEYKYTGVSLPAAISHPQSSRLPGCVLSSDEIGTGALFNLQLHVGVDNKLYVFGDATKLVFAQHASNVTGPRVQFEYHID